MDTDTSKVSLAEILEVRSEGGFESDEILALLAAASQALASRPAASGIFSAESFLIDHDGTVSIKFLPLKSLLSESIPPELRCADAKETDIGQSQMVWCLGHLCALASLPDFTDIGLHSLLNLMTVEHVQSRPSMVKVSQMVRNKMQDLDDITRVPSLLHRELMGDMQELVDDKFCDEIRLSSTRSSLSIVSGGARRSEPMVDSPPELPIRDFHLTEINEKLVVGEVADLEGDHRQSTPTPPPTKQSPPSTNGKAKPTMVEAAAGDYEELDPSNPFYTPQPSPNVSRNARMEQTWEIRFNESDESEFASFTNKSTAPNASVIVEVHEVCPITPTDGGSKGVSARYQTRQKLSSTPTTPTPTSTTRRDEIEPFEEVAGIPPPDLKRLDRLYNEKPSHRGGTAPLTDKQIEAVSFHSAQIAATQPRGNNFSRQNSLQPSKVTRRSSRGQACAVAVPEFLEKRPSPLVRLRAQSVKRKKVNIHKAESALVSVKLLNGQWLEVSCRTDAYVANIFDTVASHLDLSEHLFFGLAVKQDGEYFFLDNDQRLEKTAPSGWKARRSLPSHDYCLELRFRYYPKKLEFVKTENAVHQLYLQLRQDMLDGSLRIADRRRAEEMAALALQAEYADPPRSSTSSRETPSYFTLDDYLPNKFYPSSPPSVDGVGGGKISSLNQVHPASKFQISQVAQQHQKFIGMSRIEAESQFIQRCQQESAYGAHYYRVYKIKPSSKNPYNVYADAHLIAVVPGGIGICREQSNGARFMSSIHEWAMIRTLQFDKKRFLVATIENNIAVDHVFYTDHYTKAGYLVRFAATQHRFMIKSRFWQDTIDRVRGESPIDVGIDREFLPVTTSNPEEQKAATVAAPAARPVNGRSHEDGRVVDTEDVHYCYGSDAVKLDIVLEKHPVHGLGLTLVDGRVNEVQGVYVKSVAEVGDGKKKGLRIGDCILRVDGLSLYNRSRHDAVDLVRRGGNRVELEILRFPSISEVLGTASFSAKSSNELPAAISTTYAHDEAGFKRDDKEQESVASRRASKLSELSSRSKTPPASSGRRVSDFVSPSNQSSGVYPSQSSLAKRRRQRAVSDFGAIGDQLPVLNSDDILANEIASLSGGARGRRVQRRKSSSSHEFKEDEAQHLHSHDEDEEDSGSRHTQIRRGEYKLPASAMYTFDNEDEQPVGEVDGNGKPSSTRKAEDRDSLSHLPRHNPAASRATYGGAGRGDTFETMSWSSGSHFSKSTAFDSTTIRSAERTLRRQRSTLDWTNDLSDIDDDDADDDGAGSRDGDQRRKVFKVVIHRPEGQSSLGFQLASATGGIYLVKQISAQPALSANLRVDDIILKINDICIEGYDHQEVVQLLRNSNPYVKLEVERKEQLAERLKEETITVVLDKSQFRSIGLSLAKRMGHEGIFIRNISVGSLAAEEGSLRVGDRVWAINGEDVSNESPAGCVKRLKDIDGCFEIKVKRAVARAR